jgi:DNA-binding NarL/FixJ family response regulator
VGVTTAKITKHRCYGSGYCALDNLRGCKQVQNHINITLLSLNLIGVIYLVVRGTLRREVDPQQEWQLKIHENLNKMKHGISEQKISLDHYQRLLQQESEQWKEARKAFQSTGLATKESTIEQTLLLNDRYKEIFDLHKQGLSVEEIAQKLEKGNGEVSFILQLDAQARAKQGV